VVRGLIEAIVRRFWRRIPGRTRRSRAKVRRGPS